MEKTNRGKKESEKVAKKVAENLTGPVKHVGWQNVKYRHLPNF